MKKILYFVAGIAICCIFSSCDKDTKYVEVVKTDAEYYKTALDKLDWGTGTTYVIGHKTPDLDAVCSAIAYAALMKQLGYNCEARMVGNANNATKYASQELGFALPPTLADATGLQLILVDHNEYLQAVDGAADAKILQIIDHYGFGDILINNPIYCKILPLGSTCTIVYQSFRELGEKISDDIAKVLLAGIIDDTNNLKKDRTTNNDAVALKALMEQLKMTQEEVDALHHGIKLAERNYYGMTDTDIFNSDAKDYSIEGYMLRIGSLDWYIDETENFNSRMLAVMPSIMKDNGLDMIFTKVDKHIPNPNYNNPDDPTYGDEHLDAGSWILYSGELSKAVAEKAFGKSESEGVIFVDHKLNRKKDIVPGITQAIGELDF